MKSSVGLGTRRPEIRRPEIRRPRTRKQLGAALVLLLVCPFFSALAEESAASTESEWLLVTLKDSLAIAEGDVLRFRHTLGNVQVKTGDTDRVQVTALAQHHADDPRKPEIQFVPKAAGAAQDLRVEFAHLEVEEQEAWAKRRIDIGLLLPQGTAFEIETTDGSIETKGVTAPATLTTKSGEILCKKSGGNLTARSERGEIRVILQRTGPGHAVQLSSLTGEIWATLLEGARAEIGLETRGPITTDYSIEIDRKAGSPFKKGRVQIGLEGGSQVQIKSHSGSIRLQGLIAPEGHE